jgi:hypothetical protein
MTQCLLQFVNNSKKKWKNKREQPEKSKQLTVLMRFSDFSI